MLMGWALYRHRIDGDKLMARIGMVSALVYALLYLIKIPPLFSSISGLLNLDVAIAAQGFDEVRSLTALILKSGFFFSGYSLMFSLSDRLELQGFKHLLENMNREDNEFLESEGLIKSIREWLATDMVRLYVTLPGLKDEVTTFHYPPAANGNGHRTQVYRQGSLYDRVMTEGILLREHHDKSPWLLGQPSIIAAPVFFHDAVIGCLEAEAQEDPNANNRINLERIANLELTANLLSPAVQNFREMSALNTLNHHLAQQQIAVTEYNLDRDLPQIAENIFNVTSSSWVAVTIDIGFAEYRACFPPDEEVTAFVAGLATAGDNGGTEFGNAGNYRIIKMDLEIPYLPGLPDLRIGKLILGIDKAKNRFGYPAIGTNPPCRRALSDLITDTIVDFLRGYLNQLNDLLGVSLSGTESTTVEKWHEAVETTMRKDLRWAVLGHANSESKFWGSEGNVKLVEFLESPAERDKWEKKSSDIDQPGITDIWWRRLSQPHEQTYSVIKMSLPDSKATLWLGVGRPGFGLELNSERNYVLPWTYFLNNFCQIADSALMRILIVEERHEYMAQLQNVIAEAILSPILSHRLKNLALDLEILVNRLKDLLPDEQTLNDILLDLADNKTNSHGVLTLLSDFATVVEETPCSLLEANNRAAGLVERSLQKCRIKFNPEIDPEIRINVPLHVAANTLAIVINNAKDAIRDGGMKDGDGEIEISVKRNGAMYECHIKNNGPPIDPDILKKLFDAPAKSSKKNSNGLGLYFSRYLLRHYGADIGVTDPGPPKVKFTILFPMSNSRS